MCVLLYTQLYSLASMIYMFYDKPQACKITFKFDFDLQLKFI